jgi:hypothetical protein
MKRVFGLTLGFCAMPFSTATPRSPKNPQPMTSPQLVRFMILRSYHRAMVPQDEAECFTGVPIGSTTESRGTPQRSSAELRKEFIDMEGQINQLPAAKPDDAAQ